MWHLAEQTPRLPIDGISDIRATLDLLERQIVEYRKMLAEQEEAASVDAEPENEATPQLVELDEEQLGSVAESIADQAAAYFAGQVPTEETPEEATKAVAAELEAAEVVEEPVVAAVEMDVAAVGEVEEVPAEDEGLEAPKVDLPELFAELETQLEMGLHNAASVAVYADGEMLLEYLSAKSGSGLRRHRSRCSVLFHRANRWRRRRFGGCWMLGCWRSMRRWRAIGPNLPNAGRAR